MGWKMYLTSRVHETKLDYVHVPDRAVLAVPRNPTSRQRRETRDPSVTKMLDELL